LERKAAFVLSLRVVGGGGGGGGGAVGGGSVGRVLCGVVLTVRSRSIQMRVLNGNYDDAAVDVKIGEEGRSSGTEAARC
jgi:hypothetical protein